MAEILMDKKNRVMSQHPDQDRRIDWKEAFKYYCSSMVDGTIATYNDVAVKFGVSERTVEKIGKRNDWVKKRERAGEKALAAFIKNKEKIAEKMCHKQFSELTELEDVAITYIRSLKQAQIDFVQAKDTGAKMLALKLMANIAFNLEKSANTIKIAQQLKRVLMGLPTEISKADINSKITEATLTSDDVAKMDQFLATNAGKKIIPATTPPAPAK